MHTPLFKYDFYAAADIDIGRKRSSNQDEVIVCPQWGFYAVTDGMGGLTNGKETSTLIKKLLPEIIEDSVVDLKKDRTPDRAACLLRSQISLLSDSIYHTGNHEKDEFAFGATLSGVWLVDDCVVFVNLGDSRGYLLPDHEEALQQITCDHNAAAKLVESGELTVSNARNHPSASMLTRFVGMLSPAETDVFIRKVKPGDRLLLCSDGLYGMIDDAQLTSLMRSQDNPAKICRNLIDTANANGGRDNISVIYIRIES
jgi:serine/threonine protein phosphatase PrpC